MKTLVLFEEISERSWFCEIEGDLRHFDKVYVNGKNASMDLQNELINFMYNSKSEFKFSKLDLPTRDWDFFIKCGFIC